MMWLCRSSTTSCIVLVTCENGDGNIPSGIATLELTDLLLVKTRQQYCEPANPRAYLNTGESIEKYDYHRHVSLQAIHAQAHFLG